MFELRPFERRNNHVAAYDPWDQMERAFFGDGSWGRGLSEFKTDIQDKGDSYLLEADLPGFKGCTGLCKKYRRKSAQVSGLSFFSAGRGWKREISLPARRRGLLLLAA